jgi:Tfp pilus assembly protein PilF
VRRTVKTPNVQSTRDAVVASSAEPTARSRTASASGWSQWLRWLAPVLIVVSAPIVAWLYDRAFLSGSFRQALRQRWPLYLGLASTWGLFIPYYAVFSGRGESSQFAGFGVQTSTWYQYGLSQPGVILHYLRMCFWPQGQCLDYDWPLARGPVEIGVPLLVMGCLVAMTVWCLMRRPMWGFLGAAFFLILAPTSSIMPIVDLAFEHRMYLPLACVVAASVVGAYGLWQRWAGSAGEMSGLKYLPGLVAAILVLACGAKSWDRNWDYQTELSIWEDTVHKAPHNPRAHHGLGNQYKRLGQRAQAETEYRRALELSPQAVPPLVGLGNLLAEEGRQKDAIGYYRQALAADPNLSATHANLGAALLQVGQGNEAVEHLEKAVAAEPERTGWQISLARALAASGKAEVAIARLQGLMQRDLADADACCTLGMLQLRQGLRADAEASFRQALKLDAGHFPTLMSWGDLLAETGRPAEAAEQYRAAQQAQPKSPLPRKKLAGPGL